MTENVNKTSEKTENEQEATQKSESEEVQESDDNYRPGEWMLRPCWLYKAEYKECSSIRGRFQQNFVYGKVLDCTQWKTDYDNCVIWQKKNDDTAYNELLESEKKRRLERLRGHAINNIWKPRDKPPEDWAEPLPDWMVKRNEGTFFALKQEEINARGVDDEKDLYMPSCTIL